jgi:hypothetical protein
MSAGRGPEGSREGGGGLGSAAAKSGDQSPHDRREQLARRADALLSASCGLRRKPRRASRWPDDRHGHGNANEFVPLIHTPHDERAFIGARRVVVDARGTNVVRVSDDRERATPAGQQRTSSVPEYERAGALVAEAEGYALHAPSAYDDRRPARVGDHSSPEFRFFSRRFASMRLAAVERVGRLKNECDLTPLTTNEAVHGVAEPNTLSRRGIAIPTALDNDIGSPSRLLRKVVARLLGGKQRTPRIDDPDVNERVAVVATLLPGSRERAAQILAEGAPYGLALAGFRRHSAFLAEGAVVFAFEGPGIEGLVRGLVNDPVRSATFSVWAPLLEGTPALAKEEFYWEAGQPQ